MKMWLFNARETTRGNTELDRKLEIVSDEMSRLDRVVRNFLEFSRQRALDRQSQDMALIIDQTLDPLAPRLRSARAQVVRTAQSGLPQVLADSEQLKQVLLNLILNAVEATEGRGQIQIASSMETDADGRPMVVVRSMTAAPAYRLRSAAGSSSLFSPRRKMAPDSACASPCRSWPATTVRW